MYGYEKLMTEHKLTLNDLPDDAKIGIAEIKKVETSFKMGEKKGRKPGPAALAKIKAMDKWIIGEIIDFVDETDKNEDEIPYEAEDVVGEDGAGADGKNKGDGQSNPSPETEKGIAIEKELEALFLSSKSPFSQDDLKSSAKTAYKVIFDTYTAGEPNGIETSKYSLIETEKEGEFKLTKK